MRYSEVREGSRRERRGRGGTERFEAVRWKGYRDEGCGI